MSTPHRPPPTNQGSCLLSLDANNKIFSLLGSRCQSLSAGVVGLMEAHPPDHTTWHLLHTGVVTLTKDYSRKTYFIQMHDLVTWKRLREFSLARGTPYHVCSSTFHQFQTKEQMMGLQFASEVDAQTFSQAVRTTVGAVPKSKGKSVQGRPPIPPPPPQPQTPKEQLPCQEQSQQSSLSPPSSLPSMPSLQQTAPASPLVLPPGHRTLEKRRSSRKDKITKAMIGPPTNFQHIYHVGFDPGNRRPSLPTMTENEVQTAPTVINESPKRPAPPPPPVRSSSLTFEGSNNADDLETLPEDGLEITTVANKANRTLVEQGATKEADKGVTLDVHEMTTPSKEVESDNGNKKVLIAKDLASQVDAEKLITVEQEMTVTTDPEPDTEPILDDISDLAQGQGSSNISITTESSCDQDIFVSNENFIAHDSSLSIKLHNVAETAPTNAFPDHLETVSLLETLDMTDYIPGVASTISDSESVQTCNSSRLAIDTESYFTFDSSMPTEDFPLVCNDSNRNSCSTVSPVSALDINPVNLSEPWYPNAESHNENPTFLEGDFTSTDSTAFDTSSQTHSPVSFNDSLPPPMPLTSVENIPFTGISDTGEDFEVVTSNLNNDSLPTDTRMNKTNGSVIDSEMSFHMSSTGLEPEQNSQVTMVLSSTHNSPKPVQPDTANTPSTTQSNDSASPRTPVSSSSFKAAPVLVKTRSLQRRRLPQPPTPPPPPPTPK